MKRDEYEAKRREIIETYTQQAWEHEDAGCYGDAENARKWMRRKLEKLERDYKEGR